MLLLNSSAGEKCVETGTRQRSGEKGGVQVTQRWKVRGEMKRKKGDLRLKEEIQQSRIAALPWVFLL